MCEQALNVTAEYMDTHIQFDIARAGASSLLNEPILHVRPAHQPVPDCRLA